MLELQYLKDDIDALINVLGDLNEEDKSLFRYLGKKAIFIKDLKYNLHVNGEYSYISQLLSDIMYLIKSYKDDEIRYTYLNIRSIIEAYTRLFNRVPYGSNIISMSTLLENINRYITRNNLKDNNGKIINYSRLKSLYSESCLYIHGNKEARQTLHENYQTANNPQIDSKNKNKLNRSIRFLFETLVLLASYRFSTILNDYSIRRKLMLKYLIGDYNVSVIREYSNFISIYNHGTKNIYNDIMTSKKGSPIVPSIIPIANYELVSTGSTEFTKFDDSDICVEHKVKPAI